MSYYNQFAGHLSGSGFKNRYSFSFDGVNEYVQIADTGDLNTTAGTLTMWIKFTALSGSSLFFSMGQSASATQNPYLIHVRNTNKLGFQNFNKTTSQFGHGNSVLSSGVWYHIAFAGDGSSYGMWVDGVAQTITVEGGSAAHTGRWFGSSIYNAYTDRRFSLGACLRQTSSFFSNNLTDLVAVYDKKLSTAEVLEDMSKDDKRVTSMAGNLIMFMPIGEVAGDDATGGTGIIHDMIGSNHGTPQNTESSDLVTDVY